MINYHQLTFLFRIYLRNLTWHCRAFSVWIRAESWPVPLAFRPSGQHRVQHLFRLPKIRLVVDWNNAPQSILSEYASWYCSCLSFSRIILVMWSVSHFAAPFPWQTRPSSSSQTSVDSSSWREYCGRWTFWRDTVPLASDMFHSYIFFNAKFGTNSVAVHSQLYFDHESRWFVDCLRVQRSKITI